MFTYLPNLWSSLNASYYRLLLLVSMTSHLSAAVANTWLLINLG